MGAVFYDYKYSFTMFFWVRVSRDPTRKKMILMFGDEGDFNYFNGRLAYPSFFIEVPAGSAVSFWSLADYGGTTTEEKQDNAKAAAIAAAKAHPANWIVVEETYETQAFDNS